MVSNMKIDVVMIAIFAAEIITAAYLSELVFIDMSLDFNSDRQF